MLSKDWLLGLDMGTNSLGWIALLLENDKVSQILDMGVRVFPDGREPAAQGRVGESLAVARRTARGMRRNRDRKKGRIKHLLLKMNEFGLAPQWDLDPDACRQNSAQNDLKDDSEYKWWPYACRSNAAQSDVSAGELGRALYHLALRRGFLSNRKTGDVEENSEFKKKISALRNELGDNQTLGQFLYRRLQKGLSVRFKGEKGDWYPDRQMYIDEFNTIRHRQQNKHNLNDEKWDELFQIIFYQRPLRPVERGKCRFYTDQPRAHIGLPISHQYRIIQEINNLEYIDSETLARYRFDEEQRKTVFEKLHEQKAMSWGGMRKLKRSDGTPLFPKDSKFNFEVAKNARKELKGNETEIDLTKKFGDKWSTLNEGTKNDIVEFLYNAEQDKDVAKKAKEWGFSSAELTGYIPKSGTASVSQKFMEDIIPIMLETGKRYYEAVTDLHDEDGVLFHHSYFDDGTTVDELPYYGAILRDSMLGAGVSSNKNDPDVFQHGKINNPTVHVALNQLRKLVNSLIDEYGRKPKYIHVELSRDLKNSAKARDDIMKEINANEKENKRRKACFQELFPGQEPSALDLKKIKLWEELGGDKMDRKCVYTGRAISAAHLFNGEVEIEHILPFKRTLDDSMANKTVSFRDANRIKKSDTPYEAKERFEAQGWKWEDILSRVSRLPNSKQWRFLPEAMERFNGEDEDGFIARQLTDNAYISRTTQNYLKKLVGANNVIPVSGGMTAILRGKWGLNDLLGDHNYKERNDHRHHALDALVVALTSRGVLQHINTKRGADDRNRLIVPDLPFERTEIRKHLDNIIVSFKPEHNVSGRFFNETAYGIVPKDKQDKDLTGYNLVTSMSIENLTEKQVDAVRDIEIRSALQTYLAENFGDTKPDKNALKKALYEFGYKIWPERKTKTGKKRPALKKLRVLVANQSAFIVPSAPYKAYAPDSYVCCDIYQIPKGKPGKWKKGEYEWKGAFRSYVEMMEHEKAVEDGNIDWDSWKPHPAAKHIMRVYKNDLISLTENGRTQYMRVAGFSTTNNKLDLRTHTSATGERNFVSINALKEREPSKIHLDANGRIQKGKKTA